MCAWLLPITALGRISHESPLGEAVERHLPGDEQFMQWTRDAGTAATQAGDELATREVVVAAPETVKLQNVVPPIHFESGVADVPDSTSAELRRALDRVRDKKNVRLHLVGHADTQPLSPSLAAALRRQRRPFTRTRRRSRGTVAIGARASRRKRSRTSGRAQISRSRQRDRIRTRGQPARRSGNLVRRIQGRDRHRRIRRQERHPAGQGLPHGDRVQAALHRRS